MKLLVFGSANIDHVYHMPHLVREGETLPSTGYSRCEGGKGLNQATALAKAGQEVSFAGAIGEDGLFLKAYLDGLGIDTADLAVLDMPTGHAMIQVDALGNNSIVLFGGANQAVTPDRIDAVLAHYAPGDYLLLQNEISRGDTIIRRAAARGIRVVLNPSPMSDALLSWPLELVDWFILNEIEGRDLTGKAVPEDMLRALLHRYPRAHVVLTLGGDGSLYADGVQRFHQPVIPVPVVDTTAAGDTFTGYFLHAILSGSPAREALCLAAHAASLAVSRPGAGRSIPFAAEVSRFMRQGGLS